MPVLAYVYKKTLCLESYTLSIGHCNALSRAFEFFNKFVNRVIFDNCGIDDTEFAAILRGIKKLKDFKKIIFKRNVFFKKSLAEIEEILVRKVPHHLEELRIENCKMDPSVSHEVIKLLLKKNALKKLGLVDFSLTEASFDTFCTLVDAAPYLMDVDVSWNQLKPHSFSKLLSLIATN